MKSGIKLFIRKHHGKQLNSLCLKPFLSLLTTHHSVSIKENKNLIHILQKQLVLHVMTTKNGWMFLLPFNEQTQKTCFLHLHLPYSFCLHHILVILHL